MSDPPASTSSSATDPRSRARARHPAGVLLEQCAAGGFPTPDGSWRRAAPWKQGLSAILAVTGRALLVVDEQVADDELAVADGFGGAHDPRLIVRLAGPQGWIDTLDLVLGRPGPAARGLVPGASGAPAGAGESSAGSRRELIERPDLHTHPRARHAREVRTRARILGDRDLAQTSVATLARGIGGLPELSFELDPEVRGQGQGRAFVEAALRHTVGAPLVLASVAPGNTASLRSLLAAGFVPLGSVQLFRKQ